MSDATISVGSDMDHMVAWIPNGKEEAEIHDGGARYDMPARDWFCLLAR